MPSSFCFDFWPRSSKQHQKMPFFVHFLARKSQILVLGNCSYFWQSSTFRGITFDSVEIQKWSCTLKNPQTICQKLVMYLYGARRTHCGVGDVFLKSSQAIFCQIRYSSSVFHTRRDVFIFFKNLSFHTSIALIFKRLIYILTRIWINDELWISGRICVALRVLLFDFF